MELAISEEVELGCCGSFRWCYGDFGLVLGVEGRGRVLGFWVSLGDELEEIWRSCEGLVSGE